jgi:tetratricopeptide (TPR) repeat protein
VTDVDQESVEFLRRSLIDLDAERAADDLSAEDYARLHDEYTLRLARALRGDAGAVNAGQSTHAAAMPAGGDQASGGTAAVAAGRATGSGTRDRRWLRPAAWVLFVLALAVGGGVLVARSSGSRTSGESLTGDIREGLTSRLDQCLELSQGGQALDAVKCYDGVLKDQPSSVEALTYRAWTLVRIGDPRLVQVALGNLDQAVALDPTYADARVFRAVVLRDQGRIDDARADLAAFDALNPPQMMRSLVDQLGLRDSLTP